MPRIAIHVPWIIDETGETELPELKGKWSGFRVVQADYSILGELGPSGESLKRPRSPRAFHVFQRTPGNPGGSTTGCWELPSPFQVTNWPYVFRADWTSEAPLDVAWRAFKKSIHEKLKLQVPGGWPWRRIVDLRNHHRLGDDTQALDAAMNPRDVGDNSLCEFERDTPIECRWPGHVMTTKLFKAWSAPIETVDFAPQDPDSALFAAPFVEQVHASFSNLRLLLNAAVKQDREKGFEETFVIRASMENLAALVESTSCLIWHVGMKKAEKRARKDQRAEAAKGKFASGGGSMLSKLIHSAFEDSASLKGFTDLFADELKWLFDYWDKVRNTLAHRPGPIWVTDAETGSVPQWLGSGQAQYTAISCYRLARHICKHHRSLDVSGTKEIGAASPPTASGRNNVKAW